LIGPGYGHTDLLLAKGFLSSLYFFCNAIFNNSYDFIVIWDWMFLNGNLDTPTGSAASSLHFD